jgi:hypothetical protein
MKIETADFGEYTGATTGQAQEERWQYEGIGYNATDGIFYVGKQEAKTLEFVPFALRQCKEVTDAGGMTHRYPIKTRRAEMVEGDIVNRVQVVGLVDGVLHIFGARSWTARAAWLNPRSGEWHDDRFAVGIWYRLQDYIKQVKAEKGMTTAPFCYRLKLAAGQSIELSSAANSKQKSRGCPILAESLAFVGAAAARANEQLYIDEMINEWAAEWTKAAAVEPPTPASNGNAPAPAAGLAVTDDEDIPF